MEREMDDVIGYDSRRFRGYDFDHFLVLIRTTQWLSIVNFRFKPLSPAHVSIVWLIVDDQ